MNRKLKLTQDGRIDVAALGEWAVAALREWVLARLNDADPLWPLDRENFETPESLFIWLWRDAKPGSDFVAALGMACNELLRQSWRQAPKPWLRSLLRLVATIRPEACHQFLNDTVSHRGFEEWLRAHDLDRAWLATLAAYERQSAGITKVWQKLLHEPRYADIAYEALSHDLTMAVWCLPEYYQALTPAEQSVLLPEAVRDLLRWGTTAALEALGKYRNKLDETPGLCAAIDAELAKMGQPSVPPPADREAKPMLGNWSNSLPGIAKERPLAEVA